MWLVQYNNNKYTLELPAGAGVWNNAVEQIMYIDMANPN